jgi:hypothetical protein
MNLNDLFTPAAIAANFTQVHSNDIPYLGTSFFPAKRHGGLDLSWIKGKKGLPVSLKPSTFGTKATFRDRIGVSKLETEMPFFREAYKLDEKDRQDILRAQSSADPYVQPVIDHIYDDVNDLLSGAAVVPERMIWQLLAPASGNVGISISANGVNYSYNYDPDGSWKASNYVAITTSADQWTTPATADPLGDIQTMQDTIEDACGSRPDTAIMSRATFKQLLKCTSVQNAILAQNPTAHVFLTDPIVKQAVSDILGVDIIVYNKKFTTESGIATQFYPDNYVTLLNRSVSLGSTYYGTTPEEADLMGSKVADVSIVNDGIAISQYTEPHPVTLFTVVSEIVLPSYEGIDTVGVLKVA